MKWFLLSSLLCLTVAVQAQSSSSTFPEVLVNRHPLFDAAYMGVYSDQISQEKAKKLNFENPYGNYITRVVPGTPAEDAGLQPFDYIYQIEDQPFTRYVRFTDVLNKHRAGDEIDVKFMRKGSPQTVSVTLGSRQSTSFFTDKGGKAFLGINHQHSDGYDGTPGIGVGVVGNSTASELGLKRGDVITSINEYPMVDWSDISTVMDMMQPGDPIAIQYIRNGESRSVSGEVGGNRSISRIENINSNYNYNYNYNYNRNSKSGAYLGIYSNALDKNKAKKLGFENRYGNYVTKVIPGTPADKAGLQPFDYIIAMDDQELDDDMCFTCLLSRYNPSEKAKITVIRDGKTVVLDAVIGDRSDKREIPKKDKCEDGFLGIVQVHERRNEGVTVGVVDNSSAEDMGLQRGDELVSINGSPIIDWHDVETAIEAADPGEEITVTYIRNGQTKRVSTTLKSYSETKECVDCECSNLRQNHGIFENNTVQWQNWNNSDFNWEDGDDRSASPRYDVSDMEVNIMDMDPNEADDMERKTGADMPLVNNLQIEKINIFPNPTAGMFNLKFSLPNRGDTMIRVFNAEGREVYNYELGDFSGDFEDMIDLAQNASGIYALAISQNGKTLVKKLILTQ